MLKTPPGIIEMMTIKGLGPKKIEVIWKEMEIESPGELLYACNENRLSRYKGFGEKASKASRKPFHFISRAREVTFTRKLKIMLTS